MSGAQRSPLSDRTATFAGWAGAAPGAPEVLPARAFGKPLRWTRGFTVVVAVWALVGAALTVARADMGHLSILSERETAAIAAVERARLPDGTTFSEALRLVLDHGQSQTMTAGEEADAYWYAFDRPWEGRVYVFWEGRDAGTGEPLRLSWTVERGRVSVDPDTAAFLEKTVGAARESAGIGSTQAVGL